jgi:hypothetical protein
VSGIIRVRELYRDALEAASLQFQRLPSGPPYFEDARLSGQERGNLVDFRGSDRVGAVEAQVTQAIWRVV